MRAVFVGATALSVLPVLVGVWHRVWKVPRMRTLYVWLALTLALNLLMAIHAMNGMRTVTLQVLTLPIFGWAGAIAIRRLGTPRVAGMALVAGMTCYTLWWGWCVSRGEHLGEFSANAAPPLWWLFTVGGGLVLLPSDPVSSRAPLRDAGTLAGIGILLSYMPMATLDALSPMLAASFPDSLAPLWGLRAALLGVGSLVFAIAIAAGCRE